MRRIYHLLDSETTATDSGVVHNSRAHDETGIFFIKYNRIGTFTVKIEGRATSEAPWYPLKTFTETSSDSHNDLGNNDTEFADVVAIFPEMRASITSIAGALGFDCILNAWLID